MRRCLLSLHQLAQALQCPARTGRAALKRQTTTHLSLTRQLQQRQQ